MKKIFIPICCAIMLLSTSYHALAIDAIPTTSVVLVDGKRVDFEAFNIEGNNYFKLRDLAYALNGSYSQFNIGYDTITDTIYLTSGQSYVAVGNELQKNTVDAIEITSASSAIIKDGQNVDISAYNINGSNYFKLRDIGMEVNFEVSYNENKNSVMIETMRKAEEKASNLDENGLATDLFTTWEPPEPIPAN